MKYTETKQKKEIEIAIMMLLAEHGLNLADYCRKFNLPYQVTRNQLRQNAGIPLNWVNEFVARLDKNKKLQDRNGKLVICKSFDYA
jgi:hypothetical protein